MEMLGITLQEAGAIAGSITVIIGALYAMAKLPPVKWIARRLFKEPFSQLLTQTVEDATRVSQQEMKEFSEYVRSHLGPNGDTKPIYQRIKDMEAFHGLASLRQRRMMDGLGIGIAESDAAGNNHYVNKFLCDYLGMHPTDWEGRGWEDFIHPDDRAQEVTDFDIQIAEGGEREFHKTRFIHKDGHEMIAFTRNYPLKLDGEIIGWVGEIFPTDENDDIISNQSILERKLDFLVDHVAKNSAKLNTLQQALRDPVFRSDAEGVTIDANQAYLDLFHLRLDEIGTPKWITRLDPRGLEETLQRIEDVFKSHKSFTYDNKMRDDEIGQGKYLRFSGNPIFENGEFTGYVGTIVEISREEAVYLPDAID